MAKTISSTWTLPAVLKALDSDSPPSDINTPRPKIVQVLRGSEKHRYIVVSDKSAAVAVFVTPRARQALRESLPDRSLPSLKSSLVKLDKWHVSYWSRAANSNAELLSHELPGYLKPICLLCDHIEFVGAEGCATFGDPKYLERIPEVRQRLFSLNLPQDVRAQLARAQGMADLPDCNGEMLAPAVDDDEPPDLLELADMIEQDRIRPEVRAAGMEPLSGEESGEKDVRGRQDDDDEEEDGRQGEEDDEEMLSQFGTSPIGEFETQGGLETQVGFETQMGVETQTADGGQGEPEGRRSVTGELEAEVGAGKISPEPDEDGDQQQKQPPTQQEQPPDHQRQQQQLQTRQQQAQTGAVSGAAQGNGQAPPQGETNLLEEDGPGFTQVDATQESDSDATIPDAAEQGAAHPTSTAKLGKGREDGVEEQKGEWMFNADAGEDRGGLQPRAKRRRANEGHLLDDQAFMTQAMDTQEDEDDDVAGNDNDFRLPTEANASTGAANTRSAGARMGNRGRRGGGRVGDDGGGGGGGGDAAISRGGGGGDDAACRGAEGTGHVSGTAVGVKAARGQGARAAASALLANVPPEKARQAPDENTGQDHAPQGPFTRIRAGAPQPEGGGRILKGGRTRSTPANTAEPTRRRNGDPSAAANGNSEQAGLQRTTRSQARGHLGGAGPFIPPSSAPPRRHPPSPLPRRDSSSVGSRPPKRALPTRPMTLFTEPNVLEYLGLMRGRHAGEEPEDGFTKLW